jgi:hypothetical protein
MIDTLPKHICHNSRKRETEAVLVVGAWRATLAGPAALTFVFCHWCRTALSLGNVKS